MAGPDAWGPGGGLGAGDGGGVDEAVEGVVESITGRTARAVGEVRRGWLRAREDNGGSGGAGGGGRSGSPTRGGGGASAAGIRSAYLKAFLGSRSDPSEELLGACVCGQWACVWLDAGGSAVSAC